MTTPRASWSTAHSSSATLTSLTSAATRTKPAPIHNPYDKFTKPQFDAWIDDITGTLRRALGHIDDSGREDSLLASDESSMGHIDAEQVSESSEVDGDIEDSFAELKARRASKKGKARDPREGPGLLSGRGNGSYEEPIDLASDSEDEEAQVEELARVIDDTDYGSEWEDQDELEQSEQVTEDVDPETDAEVDYEDEENHEEEAGSDMDEGNGAYDEDENEEQLDLWKTDQSSSPPIEYEVLDADDEDRVEKSDEPEVIELLSDEEISITGSSPPALGESEGHSAADMDEEDQDQGLHEDAAVSPDICDVDDDDEQPLHNDTAFPATVSGHSFLNEPVEIVDPWVRPQQYANDLYKGGDHLPDPETHPSPHKLGETDDNSTSVTPRREVDEDMMLFEVSRYESPEVSSHLPSLFHASYPLYDPDSIGTTNKEEYYTRRAKYRETALPVFSSVFNHRPDEGHHDTDNDVTALNNNLEGPSSDLHDEMGASNNRLASPELAAREKQFHERPAVPFANSVDELVYNLYGDLKTESTVEETGHPVSGPVFNHEDVTNVQHSQDAPMNPELTGEDHESDPPHVSIDSSLNAEVSAVSEPEAHLNPDVAAGPVHHPPFEAEFPHLECLILPAFVTPDIPPVEASDELQDGHDAEEPAFLPTPPADEPTITSDEVSSALNQVNSVQDETGACDDSKQQEAKHEPSLVPETVDYDAMGIHEENPELADIDVPVIVEPAAVHTGAATDNVTELKEDNVGREIVAPAEIFSQEVITAADNHPSVIPQTQADDIPSVIDEVPTALVDDTSAAPNFIVDKDKTTSEGSPIVVVDETCAALANTGSADAIDISSATLPHENPTFFFEEGLAFEPPVVVAAGDHAGVDNHRVDISVLTTNEIPAVFGNDGASTLDEACFSRSADDSPSVPMDISAIGPADALVPTDGTHTVDADMTVDVWPPLPDGIYVVKAEHVTDTSPIVVPADIASSPSASPGSPAPADPHTPPTLLKIQTDLSPLFTPHTHIKRQPPGLMTTPPSSEGDSSDYVPSPSQRDGEENQHGPDPEEDHLAKDQVAVDPQDVVAGMKPSESAPFQPEGVLLTRAPTWTPPVVPTTRARALSVLQPDPYPYSLSTPSGDQRLSKSGSDEISEDENENDLSNTSSSSNDRELESNHQDIHDSQNMPEPTVGVHLPSEIPSISTNEQPFKDSISATQPINSRDATRPLSPIEESTDIESSPRRPNGVPSTSPRQILQVVIKTDDSSSKQLSQEVLDAESPTVDRNDVQGSRSTKRKRKSSGSAPLTHTLNRKRRGKGKEDLNGSPAPSDATSPGGLATKLLTYSRKRSVSRASSSTPSETSVSTSQGPLTPTRPAALQRPPVHYPPALLHGHSTQPRPVRHRHHLPTAGPSRASSTSSLDRLSYYSSPVTRSNCRYRHISLPKVEGGPRISFLVPGCSLGDIELMEEEEIVDHGDATTEDSRRVVPDIENLDFSPYLIGVLRQLVGVDLLREQEVYYLCAVGEDPRLVQKQKTDRFTVNRIGESSNSSRSLSGSVRSPSSSIRPPVSGGSIVSTSPGIVVKQEDDGYDSSISLSTAESHIEALAPPPTKRQKTSVDTPPPPSASTSRTQMKNMMRRSLKPIAYLSAPVAPVPEEEDSDISGDELPFGHRPKATRARGLKRARTDVQADEEEGRRFKKLKGRLSDIH